MPSISQDWQGRLVERDFLFGRDTNYPGIGGVTDVGVLEPRLTDVVGLGDGAAWGMDRHPARTLTIPMTVLGDTSAEVWANYRLLAVAWRRSTAELALDLRLPGAAETVQRFYGRPNGVPAAPHGLKGTLVTLAEFRCGPLCYGAEHTAASAASASPFTIPAGQMGDPGADTDRVTITIVGNGGTPTITHGSGGAISFVLPLAVGVEAVFDLHDQTIDVNDAAADGAGNAGDDWFRLVGGAENEITATGCASIEVTWRPGYGVP